MEVNLVLMTKDGAQKEFHLPSAVTIIGRRQDCDLCIPLMNVSRRHCEINQDEGKLKVRDLGSKNGTFVNGTKVDQTEVSQGDQISIGPIEFVLTMSKMENSSSAIMSAPNEIKKQEVSKELLKSEGHYDKSKNDGQTQIMDSLKQ